VAAVRETVQRVAPGLRSDDMALLAVCVEPEEPAGLAT
jgi:hypothetical protein